MINKNIITGLLGIIILLGVVSAFGVVSYGEPVKVRPGESINLSFALQNMVGDQDYIVESQIGTEAKINLLLLDNNTKYLVPLGSEIPVHLRVTVPIDAEVGKEYIIGATFTASSSGSNGGGLGLQTAIGSKIIIRIANESDDTNKITPKIPPTTPKEKGRIGIGAIITLIILIIIVIAVIIYVRKKNTLRVQAKNNN